MIIRVTTWAHICVVYFPTFDRRIYINWLLTFGVWKDFLPMWYRVSVNVNYDLRATMHAVEIFNNVDQTFLITYFSRPMRHCRKFLLHIKILSEFHNTHAIALTTYIHEAVFELPITIVVNLQGTYVVRWWVVTCIHYNALSELHLLQFNLKIYIL